MRDSNHVKSMKAGCSFEHPAFFNTLLGREGRFHYVAIESVKGPQLRKLYLVYVLAALIPVGLFVLVQIPLLWQWNTIHHAQQQRNQIKEEILRLQRLTADIENGFRGYVLTTNRLFFIPWCPGRQGFRTAWNT